MDFPMLKAEMKPFINCDFRLEPLLETVESQVAE